MTTTSEYVDYFTYLDDLRESGVTNMFGARPYLEAEFDPRPVRSCRRG